MNTVHSCGRCGSQHLRRNGRSNGKPRYHCQSCGYYGYLWIDPTVEKAKELLVFKHHARGHSLRRIAQLTGLSRTKVTRLVRTATEPAFLSASAHE
ncbi:transposase-like zinc-binding domain-containing protein [Spirosoma montaniterrae]|uniref:transposase-like zinc-binding domain-containing protein n=1 Tax=Spirosoma montaniterrae TaxID=1178516 RepID=UPI00097DB7C2